MATGFIWGKYRGLKRIKICEYCGKQFEVYPYRLETAKYCSLECRNKGYEGKSFWSRSVKRVCQECGKEFEIPKSLGKQKFCSRECSDKGQKRVKYWKGKRRKDKTREKISKKLKGKFAGDKHWNWLGGKSSEPYGSEFDSYLKTTIRRRDGFTCQECGYSENQLGYTLIVHHIDYNKRNNSEDNLVSLCRSCHAKTNFDRDDWKHYFMEKMEVKYGGNL